MIPFLRIPLCLGVVATILSAVSTPLHAQFRIQPSLGLQTIWFNGQYPVSDPLSPDATSDRPLGGGVMGNSNGIHLQAELIPSPSGFIRIPVVAEAFFLSGRTTFALTEIGDPNPQRWTFRHDAEIYSLGLGVAGHFFSEPSLYIQAEGRLYHIPPTELRSRIYYSKSDETIRETSVTPDSLAHTRYGAFVKVGTQLPFYGQFLVDFNVGYGAINLAGRDVNPLTGRNLIVVDDRHFPERIVGYLSFGLSIAWKSLQ